MEKCRRVHRQPCGGAHEGEHVVMLVPVSLGRLQPAQEAANGLEQRQIIGRQGLADRTERGGTGDRRAGRTKAKVMPPARPPLAGAARSDRFFDEARALLFDQASSSLAVPACTDM